MANGYDQILNSGAQRYRRRLRGESRFGNVEESSLSPIREALDTAISGIAGRQQREIKMERDQFEQAYIDRSLRRLENAFKGPRSLSGKETNQLLDKTTVDLLRHGGSKARQTAADIQKLRKQEKTDLSVSPEEAYMRGQISYGELQRIKKAGKDGKREASLLRSGKETIDGVTKVVDYYGYTDERGRPVVTQKKYSDFTKGGGGGLNLSITPDQSSRLKTLEAKKNAAQRKLKSVVDKGVSLDKVLTDRSILPEEWFEQMEIDGKKVDLSEDQLKDMKQWLAALDEYEEYASSLGVPIDYAERLAGEKIESAEVTANQRRERSGGRKGKGF